MTVAWDSEGERLLKIGGVENASDISKEPEKAE
jgi:hypothetical protein